MIKLNICCTSEEDNPIIKGKGFGELFLILCCVSSGILGHYEKQACKNVTLKTAVGDFVIYPRANITFRAGYKIMLKEGFSAKAGSTFRAYIEPFLCSFTAGIQLIKLFQQ